MRPLKFFRRGQTDWGSRNVLVGTLRNFRQLDAALDGRFYHVPADLVEDPEKIEYVAIYQSVRLFGQSAGIWWYGRVRERSLLPRYEIREIPKTSPVVYCRLDIERWMPMPRPILPRETWEVCFMTTLWQLLHSSILPELQLEDPARHQLMGLLLRMAASRRPRRLFFWRGICFRRPGNRILAGRIGGPSRRILPAEFREAPAETMEQLLKSLL